MSCLVRVYLVVLSFTKARFFTKCHQSLNSDLGPDTVLFGIRVGIITCCTQTSEVPCVVTHQTMWVPQFCQLFTFLRQGNLLCFAGYPAVDTWLAMRPLMHLLKELLLGNNVYTQLFLAVLFLKRWLGLYRGSKLSLMKPSVYIWPAVHRFLKNLGASWNSRFQKSHM